ncbi:GlsB/YeaQ/YmgE family stress response membrane protein [Marinilabiliaceae bacterium ANBcel2]|nr:GlsB/YeaQ/YmgE family stress response membrane protein [Marinilabiliaceae bacterium ANBcel2]
MGTILTLIIGLLAGYIASLLMKGRGHGLILNLVIGLLGGFLGGVVFSFLFGIEGGNILWKLISSVVGAVILLWIVAAINRR